MSRFVWRAALALGALIFASMGCKAENVDPYDGSEEGGDTDEEALSGSFAVGTVLVSTADVNLRFEVFVGADDGVAVGVELVGELACGGEAVAGRVGAAADACDDLVEDLLVEGL